ncbi:P-loop containing nucleoside triphosphate hydrolase protein [Hortaea werneckii]|nr:P-loop containing nucleoside triphosphate hydrolase protein [Hortaea werneckii]KAI7109303.1 P-loop containing nucleoside triphosphate hydrolase protein [Hortaea werneckii]KAI7229349.1 P-loop containing nucleoside triphosphate hydrolase protein [Hortaea werneckii]KAI7299738.1 P-loop containing nucleoside triphosphate hydrolase protein [Hortaea werneckii]KAI7385295.1 P-loop containing nucleoside triphosphate hydrolase protein [Hortaea werneckii]
MTNLLTVLPDLDIRPFTHILPSLEKALVSTADLLTLEPVDIAKRAQVPPREVEKLATTLVDGLHGGSGDNTNGEGSDAAESGAEHATNGEGLVNDAQAISTLDDDLDQRLNGGIAVGAVTEVVGESAAGKTQFLLTLLLSVQAPEPLGLGKAALYISTEAPLQTTRLNQLLERHPKLATLPPENRPSLSKIQSTRVHDLEAQDHILCFQVPALLSRPNSNIGLLVIDSIAANYRPEFDKGHARRTAAEAFAKRSQQVAQLGALLRDIARKYSIAVVVANQVADRFTSQDQAISLSQMASQPGTQRSRPGSPPQSTARRPTAPPPLSQHIPLSTTSDHSHNLSTDDPLSLDHQQCFFTGWGDNPFTHQNQNLKTPSLGLTWTNQLSTRIALLREPVYTQPKLDEEMVVSSWRRTMKLVFSNGCAEFERRFEITEGGIRAVKDEESGN